MGWDDAIWRVEEGGQRGRGVNGHFKS